MYTKKYIMGVLKDTQKKVNLKLGLAGSYARGDETSSSDVDIVVDSILDSFDMIDYLKSLFDDVDVVQLPLLKKDDEDMDAFLHLLICL